MKTYKILTLAVMALGIVSCRQTLFEDVSKAGVSVSESENVKYNGNIITVKKGEPVNFNLAGSPDYITFFSGELGHQYIYRKTVEGDIDNIKSSRLKFTLWSQYGYTKGDEPQMAVLFATQNPDGTPVFPGLSRNFEQDSIMVEENIDWNYLVDPELIPNKSGDKYNVYDGIKTEFSCNIFDIDVTDHIREKFTLALVQNKEKKQVRVGVPAEEKTYGQTTWHFEDMCLETTWKDGRVTKVYANAFGFTPINMKHKTVFEDHKDNEYQMPIDKEYGAVKASVEGCWNFSNLAAGKIDISGCAQNFEWKYSWLVSDYIDFAAKGEADQGVNIKDINLPVTSYEHTYNKVGTYKATFVMTNDNVYDAQQKVVEFVINVVESL